MIGYRSRRLIRRSCPVQESTSLFTSTSASQPMTTPPLPPPPFGVTRMPLPYMKYIPTSPNCKSCLVSEYSILRIASSLDLLVFPSSSSPLPLLFVPFSYCSLSLSSLQSHPSGLVHRVWSGLTSVFLRHVIVQYSPKGTKFLRHLRGRSQEETRIRNPQGISSSSISFTSSSFTSSFSFTSLFSPFVVT